MLTVHLFAGMAEAAGARRLDIEWAGGTVGALRQVLAARWPAIAELLARSAVAVGNAYAPDSLELPAFADVAIIPPVSGG